MNRAAFSSWPALVILSTALLLLVVVGSGIPTGITPATAPGLDEGFADGVRPAWERAPGVPATFLRDSYGPGEAASLVLWRAEKAFTLQFFRVNPGRPGWTNTFMQGTAVSRLYRFGPTEAHRPLPVQIGDWPSGVYFARLRAGRLVGFAPLVVRPRHLGMKQALVVMPTFTWQAYNFRDDNHDGRGDTWYAGTDIDQVRLARPFLARGVPPHFVAYDLPFLSWLQRTGNGADFIADTDLDAVAGAESLRRDYTLIVFPGHHEYVTGHEYDVVTGYRNLGGHLMFLCANDFFWQVLLSGDTLTRTYRYRTLGRPEASLIGVQFIRADGHAPHEPWKVVTTKRWPWLFAGTKLSSGSTFGNGGVEVDHIAGSSPRGTTVVAQIPDVLGHGYTAQMTYYEQESGAKVFAAGAFVFDGGRDSVSARILLNLWHHLEHSATVRSQAPESRWEHP